MAMQHFLGNHLPHIHPPTSTLAALELCWKRETHITCKNFLQKSQLVCPEEPLVILDICLTVWQLTAKLCSSADKSKSFAAVWSNHCPGGDTRCIMHMLRNLIHGSFFLSLSLSQTRKFFLASTQLTAGSLLLNHSKRSQGFYSFSNRKVLWEQPT